MLFYLENLSLLQYNLILFKQYYQKEKFTVFYHLKFR